MSDQEPNTDNISQHPVAEYHRTAAFHFQQAAEHHLVAAEADEKNDLLTASYHAYVAHGHQLRAVEYAAIAAEDAAMDGDEHSHTCCDESCDENKA